MAVFHQRYPHPWYLQRCRELDLRLHRFFSSLFVLLFGMLDSNMALRLHCYKVLNHFVGNPPISTLAIAKQCHVRIAIVIRFFWIFVLMHTNVCETLFGLWV